MSFINIVLYQPEIPQNTGNIARMCVSNDLKLHLIKPLGFEITDKYLKRSGLDYWQYLDYEVYKDWDEFLLSLQGSETTEAIHVPDLAKPSAWISSDSSSLSCNDKRIWFLTTKAEKSFWDVEFKEDDYLVFGPETRGLPEDLMKKDWSKAIKVPMRSDKSRSLNLASTVQTVFYEAFRQLLASG